jgi:hypothetical protein
VFCVVCRTSRSIASATIQEIYKRLLLVGPGPAAFYRDACRLMAERGSVESLSHIASHLMREIESALRAVLGTLPDAGEPDASAGQEGHRRSILRVLIALDIQEDHAVAKSWLGLAGSDNPYGLSARAHRDALARPRPVDNEFISLWDEFQAVLGYVLDRFEGRFLEPHAVLDELLALDAPSTDDLRRLRQQVGKGSQGARDATCRDNRAEPSSGAPQADCSGWRCTTGCTIGNNAHQQFKSGGFIVERDGPSNSDLGDAAWLRRPPSRRDRVGLNHHSPAQRPRIRGDTQLV